MVANTKEEENRQTNENGKQSFKIFPALKDKIRVGRIFFCPWILNKGYI